MMPSTKAPTITADPNRSKRLKTLLNLRPSDCNALPFAFHRMAPGRWFPAALKCQCGAGLLPEATGMRLSVPSGLQYLLARLGFAGAILSLDFRGRGSFLLIFRGQRGPGTLKTSCLGQRPATKRADATGARLSCVFPSGWASLSAWPRIDCSGPFFLTFAICCRKNRAARRGFALPPQTGLTLWGYLSLDAPWDGYFGNMANFAPTRPVPAGAFFLPICRCCRIGYRGAAWPQQSHGVVGHEQLRPGWYVRAFFHLKNSSALRVPSRRYTRSAHE